MNQLREFVQVSQMYGCKDTAIFFADKLVSMQPDHPDARYILASMFFAQGDFRRALSELNIERSAVPPAKHTLLAAQCLIEVKDWDGALVIIGDEEQSLDENDPVDNTCFNVLSAICLTRGIIFEAQENRTRAIFWFMKALRHDAKCYDAFRRLVHERMLPVDEERSFFNDLEYPSDCPWLKDVYLCEINQYDHTNETLQSDIQSLSKYNLHHNADLLSCSAQQAYNQDQFRVAYNICKEVLDKHAHHKRMLPIYLCCLVYLKNKNELFYAAHQLVDIYPGHAISWFAVGCYYYLIERYEQARRYFQKSTSVDPRFAPAWIAYGHSFAAQNECDQAMSAYSTVQRLFKGSHFPSLFLGLEHLRTNNLQSSEVYIMQSMTACPSDPLIYNELGVIHYRNRKYDTAIQCFTKTIQLIVPGAWQSWEPTFFNIGHCFRKQGQYEKALDYYETAKSICPMSASIYTAIGFTYDLQGEVHTAISNYHMALGINPRDIVTSDLMARALSKLFMSS